VGELVPLLGGAPPVSASAKVDTLEITVARSEAGGLGIDVDKSNVIQGSSGQKDLQVGDRVIAIDGEPLGSKFVAQGLAPGKPQYTFTVERGGGGAARLEETLTTLAASEEAMHGAAGLSALDPANGETAKKICEHCCES